MNWVQRQDSAELQPLKIISNKSHKKTCLCKNIAGGFFIGADFQYEILDWYIGERGIREIKIQGPNSKFQEPKTKNQKPKTKN
jgi:hypothetical protein